MSQRRTDHHTAFLDRRHEAHRREHARARSDGGAAQDQVELLARQHRERTRHVDTPAARADAADEAARLGLRHHLVEHAELAQRVVGVGDQAVTADLVAREHVLVDQHHVMAGARQRDRRGTAGRAGADDEHVARGGE